MVDEVLAQRLAELDDAEFERLYGPLARLSPDDGAALLDGFDRPWWVAGGWSLEVFTGAGRDHDDLDIGMFGKDLPAFVDHFSATHDVWIAGSGSLCPLLSPEQPLPRWANQVWVRESATGPWLLDVIMSPDRDGRWVFRHDPDVVEDLDTVTLVRDGITYQTPEVTLAFKSKNMRTKDQADFDAALPLLDADATRWLAETVSRLHPGHTWLDRLSP